MDRDIPLAFLQWSLLLSLSVAEAASLEDACARVVASPRSTSQALSVLTDLGFVEHWTGGWRLTAAGRKEAARLRSSDAGGE